VSAPSNVGRKRLNFTTPPRGGEKVLSGMSVRRRREQAHQSTTGKQVPQRQSTRAQQAASSDGPSHSVRMAKNNWVEACVLFALRSYRGQLGTLGDQQQEGNSASSLGREGRVPVCRGQDVPSWPKSKKRAT